MTISPEAALAEIQRRAVTDRYWTFKPLPNSKGQNDFVKSVLSEMNGVFVFIAGNRAGKSTIGAWLVAHIILQILGAKARAEKRRPIVWVIGQRLSDVSEIAWKSNLKKFIPESEIEAIVYRSRVMDHPDYIRTRDGVEIYFRASEQTRAAFQGVNVDLVWFDEQVPEDVFQEVQVRCIDRAAPILMTLTPLDPDPFLEVKYNDPPKGWNFFHGSINDNRKSRGGYLPDEEIDRVIEEWPVEIRETRVEGRFSSFQGCVYQSFKRSLHVIDDKANPLFTRMHRDWKRYIGLDLGVNNPTCAIWGTRDDDGTWWIYGEHYQAKMDMPRHIAAISARCEEHGYWGQPEKIAAIFADPGGDKMPTGPTLDLFYSGRAALVKAGYTVAMPNKQVHQGINTVRTLLNPRRIGDTEVAKMYISGSRCPNLIRELATYRWTSQTATRDAKEEPLKKGDHSCDALRMMCHTVEVSNQDPGSFRVHKPANHSPVLRYGT